MNSASLRKLAFGSPLIKAFALATFALLGNVLTGAYVSAITKTEGSQAVIVWGDTHRTPLFWCLMVLLIVMALYGWGMTVHESRAAQGLAATELALAQARTALANERNAGLAAEYRRSVLEEMGPEILAYFKRRLAAGDGETMEDINRALSIDRGGVL